VLVLAGLTFVGYRYGAFVSIEYLDAIRHGYAGGGADFLPDFRVEGVLDVAALLGAGSLFVLAAPFPWDAVHVHRAAYAPLAAVGLAIAVLGVVGLSAAVRRRPAAAAPVVIAAVALLCVLALLEYNSGIVVRHRLPLTALLTVGAAVLLAGRRGR